MRNSQNLPFLGYAGDFDTAWITSLLSEFFLFFHIQITFTRSPPSAFDLEFFFGENRSPPSLQAIMDVTETPTPKQTLPPPPNPKT